MSVIKCFASLSLAALTLPALHAAPRCPGGIGGVTPRFVQRALVVIPVRINQTGPYDFMVDTGSQLTIIDPSLASELHLEPQGKVGLISVASYTLTSATVLDTLEAGSHVVEKPFAVVQDLRQIQAADPRIRGILGENFLEHFDLFIDYAHGILCLDDTKQMQEKVRGGHIGLTAPPHPERNLPFTQPLIVPVHVSGVAEQPLLLQLDSGINGPLVFDSRKLQHTAFASSPLHARGTDGVVRAFTILPPQDIQVGMHSLHQISFVAPTAAGKDIPNWEIDGVLPTILFQRAFISFADHFAVLDPW